jgi:hypothetical protein
MPARKAGRSIRRLAVERVENPKRPGKAMGSPDEIR